MGLVHRRWPHKTLASAHFHFSDESQTRFQFQERQPTQLSCLPMLSVMQLGLSCGKRSTNHGKYICFIGLRFFAHIFVEATTYPGQLSRHASGLAPFWFWLFDSCSIPRTNGAKPRKEMIHMMMSILHKNRLMVPRRRSELTGYVVIFCYLIFSHTSPQGIPWYYWYPKSRFPLRAVIGLCLEEFLI